MKWKNPTDTGWFVRLTDAHTTVAIFDPSETLRGELIPASGDDFSSHFSRMRKESLAARIDRYGPALTKARPATLRLSDGSIGTVLDQKPQAMTRANKACDISIAGRAYCLAHTSGRKATATRDGVPLTRLIRGHRLRAIDVRRKNSTTTDELDECILTLFHKVILPGREGALSELMSYISI